MCGAIHPLPQYAFMAWCSIKKSTVTLIYTRNNPQISSDTVHASFKFYIEMIFFHFGCLHMPSVDLFSLNSSAYKVGLFRLYYDNAD
jgi:hypothetical protein